MAAEKTVRVYQRRNESVGTLFKEDPGPIYLFPDGAFGAQYEGKWVFRSSVKALENLLGKKRKFAKLFCSETQRLYYDCKPRVEEISEFTDHDKAITSAGKKIYARYSDTWYLYDEAIVAELNKIEQDRVRFERELNNRHEAALKNAKRINKHKLKDMLKSGEIVPEPPEVVDVFNDDEPGDAND